MAVTPGAPTVMVEERHRKVTFGALLAGVFFGLLLGIGAGLLLSQVGIVDMTSKVSLVVPALGLVLGLLAVFLGGRPRRAV